ncbi:MAG TPA: DNA gyrase subunit A, partial [Ignavibacteria bacterium]|nr:DNA gyrase subunit A [Ignavibacteria bacterium]
EELKEVKEKYGDERRTEVVKNYEEFSLEDMIAEEDVVVTISHSGFIKRFPVSGYRKQGRGGKGVTGAGTKNEDFIEHMFVASTHHYILIFTDRGKCYWLKVHEVPEAGRTARGRAIQNLIQKDKEENITAFVAVKEFSDEQNIIMATLRGTIKKTILSAYGNVRKGGINAINIVKNDKLISVKLTDGNNDIVLGTRNGYAIRFNEKDVRPMGRTATGVRGVRLGKDDIVVGLVVMKRQATILVVTEKGYGKRSDINDYRTTHRGGKGVITVKTSDRVGKLISMMEVVDGDELVIITTHGMVIKQGIKNIRVMGRNTQGVRVIRLNESDSIADIAKVVRDEEDNDSNNEVVLNVE